MYPPPCLTGTCCGVLSVFILHNHSHRGSCRSRFFVHLFFLGETSIFYANGHHTTVPEVTPRQKHRAQFRIPMGGSQKTRARFDAVFDARGRADGVCARTWAQRVSPHVHLRANACIQPWALRVSVNVIIDIITAIITKTLPRKCTLVANSSHEHECLADDRTNNS